MRRYLLLLILSFGLVGVAQAEEPKVVGFLFTAEWCSNCKVLKPKLTAVQEEFSGQPIAYEQIDLTNSATRQATVAAAREKGYGLVARRYARATGHMVLVNAETKEVVERIFSGFSKDQIREKFRAALAL